MEGTPDAAGVELVVPAHVQQHRPRVGLAQRLPADPAEARGEQRPGGEDVGADALDADAGQVGHRDRAGSAGRRCARPTPRPYSPTCAGTTSSTPAASGVPSTCRSTSWRCGSTSCPAARGFCRSGSRAGVRRQHPAARGSPRRAHRRRPHPGVGLAGAAGGRRLIQPLPRSRRSEYARAAQVGLTATGRAPGSAASSGPDASRTGEREHPREDGASRNELGSQRLPARDPTAPARLAVGRDGHRRHLFAGLALRPLFGLTNPGRADSVCRGR